MPSSNSTIKSFLKYLLCSAGLTMFCFSCQSSDYEVLPADLNLLQEVSNVGADQNVGVFGGSGKKRIPPVNAEKAPYRLQGEMLTIDFAENGYFQFIPAAIGWPETWLGVRQLELELEAEQPGTLLVQVYGNRTRLIDTLTLQSGSHTYLVDVTEVPLLGGTEARPLYLRLESPSEQRIIIRSMQLGRTTEHPFLVDRWGQRARNEWAGKVKDLNDLHDQQAEAAFLEQFSHTAKLDPYGGFTEHALDLRATGFFHTQFVDDRWWLVSPAGNPFYSLGVNGVRIKSIRSNADVSLVKGREWQFEEIPSVEECPECFREDGAFFSYYCWNVKRKYASIDDWRTQTYKRLKTLGFNTIGNWSDTIFYKDPQLPYTYTLDTRKDTSLVMANNLPDVFHPDWEAYLEQIFSEILRFKEDPFLLGYFVDNEMSWRSVTRLDSNSYTAGHLQQFSTPEVQAAVYAERYFSSVWKAIQKFDPNHLYLGCRFTRNFRSMEPIARAAGKYVDVLSINIYSGYPIREQTDQWHTAAGKPILIGEHHLPPITPKQHLPHYPAFTTEERNQMLENYVKTWLSYPYALGSHWYQYKDQEVAGRDQGGENQPIGLVTVTDQLNRPLVETYYGIAEEIPKNLLAK